MIKKKIKKVKMLKNKKRLIDTTFKHLYKNGYCGTGISAILEETELTKGAMYYSFKSKKIMVIETIEHHMNIFIQKRWGKPLMDSNEPIHTLIEQIDNYINAFKNKRDYLKIQNGSPLGNFIADMSGTDKDIAKVLKNFHEEWREIIENSLEKAILLGQIMSNINTKKQSLFILNSIEGGVISAKAHNNINIFEDVMEVLKAKILDMLKKHPL